MAMNQMQQMLANAQRMQRELNKAYAALEEKEFTASKSGIVEVVVLGNKQIKSINIDKDALDPENKEMVEEAIVLALNEVNAKIDEEKDAIEEKITGKGGGLGF